MLFIILKLFSIFFSNIIWVNVFIFGMRLIRLVIIIGDVGIFVYKEDC